MMSAGQRAKRSRFRFRRWQGLFMTLLLATCAMAQDSGRIGYVDMKRLIDNAPQVIAARARLAQEFDAQDRELRVASGNLAALDARIRDEVDSLPASELQALQRQADALRRSIERTRQRLRDELETRTEQELDRAWPRINEAVADYAREVGYELIVASPVVYVSGRIDITDRVIERLKRDFDATDSEP
jgi:outer membrane protein